MTLVAGYWYLFYCNSYIDKNNNALRLLTLVVATELVWPAASAAFQGGGPIRTNHQYSSYRKRHASTTVGLSFLQDIDGTHQYHPPANGVSTQEQRPDTENRWNPQKKKIQAFERMIGSNIIMMEANSVCELSAS